MNLRGRVNLSGYCAGSGVPWADGAMTVRRGPGRYPAEFRQRVVDLVEEGKASTPAIGRVTELLTNHLPSQRRLICLERRGELGAGDYDMPGEATVRPRW